MSRDRALDHLHPEARRVDYALDLTLGRLGIRTRRIETWRDPGLQAADWAKGRDDQGRVVDRAAVVTWKKPGYSWHNLTLRDGTPASLAWHRAIITSEGLLGFGLPLTALGRRLYGILGMVAEDLGCRWGGNWDGDGEPMEPGEDDLTHVEYHPGFAMTQAKTTLAAGRDLADLVTTRVIPRRA